MREALAAYPFPAHLPRPGAARAARGAGGYAGVPAEHILPGRGADELIDLVCRLCLAPGDAIIDCPPTFGMYEFVLRSTARVINVPRG